MKLKRVITIFMFVGLFLTLVGCNEMGSVTKRFEKEGYTVEMMDKDHSLYEEDYDDMDGLKNIYFVLDEDDQMVAMIFEFSSEKALKDALDNDNVDIEDYKEFINKNLFISASDQDIIDIFQGK